MTNPYKDIIHMPHHVSSTREPMSMAERAAQFSPFAALTGHDAAIRETARLTDAKIELSEDELNTLDEQYRRLAEHPDACPEVSITYFKRDERKNGGSYVTVSGIVKKTDPLFRKIYLADGIIIAMDDVFDIAFKNPT